LNAFDERDAAFFFGREAATTAVLARLSRKLDGSGLLVISGVSGAGKSSAAAGRDTATVAWRGARGRTGVGGLAVPGVHPRSMPRWTN
jgi:hypothetical protein